MGKAHACYQGYARAKGSWLLFTDADTEHAPSLLSSVMDAVSERGASVATVIGQQRHPTFAVYLVNLAVFTCSLEGACGADRARSAALETWATVIRFLMVPKRENVCRIPDSVGCDPSGVAGRMRRPS